MKIGKIALLTDYNNKKSDKIALFYVFMIIIIENQQTKILELRSI